MWRFRSRIDLPFKKKKKTVWVVVVTKLHVSMGCNSSFITMFPKVERPLLIIDYRPMYPFDMMS